jgi:hypothetical protein
MIVGGRRGEETWRPPPRPSFDARRRAWGRSGVRVAVCRWEATNNQRTAVRFPFKLLSIFYAMFNYNVNSNM